MSDLDDLTKECERLAGYPTLESVQTENVKLRADLAFRIAEYREMDDARYELKMVKGEIERLRAVIKNLTAEWSPEDVRAAAFEEAAKWHDVRRSAYANVGKESEVHRKAALHFRAKAVEVRGE